MKITIIINNRDLLTWPRAMVEKCKTLDNVGDIVIVDNGSTYPPLLEWYETNPCIIARCENIGHQAPWISGTVAKYASPFYVVTDPDLGIDDIPADTLTVLQSKLERNPRLGKVGLGLDWRAVKSSSPYFGHMMTYERVRWLSSAWADGVALNVAIDTTFALYNVPRYFIGGGSLDSPYTAEHYPWYFNQKEREEDKEFLYYLRHANQSASYLSFLGLNYQKLTDLQASNPELYNTDKFGTSDHFTTHHYGDFYDELFFDDREKPLEILEIGTYKGGFLRLIHDYLPKANIYGVDINPLWKPGFNDRITLGVKNAYDLKNWADLPNFDIIIEDGPHTLQTQLFALQNFPNMLNPGGLLVIEDVPKENLKKLLMNYTGIMKNLMVYNWVDQTGRNDDIIITVRK